MKLAEALSRRAELQTKISQLKERMMDSAKVQEGDEPTEDVTELYAELDKYVSVLETLVYMINYTNLNCGTDEESITQLIAKRDALSLKIKTLLPVLEHVSGSDDRYGRNEIKYVRTIDVKSLRRMIDSYSESLRKLDMKIQELNWTVDLLE